MIVLTSDEKGELLQPENLSWTMMSAVAGDDLRYGVQMLVERLQTHQNDEKQLTVEQIIETLSYLIEEHKTAMDSVY